MTVAVDGSRISTATAEVLHVGAAHGVVEMNVLFGDGLTHRAGDSINRRLELLQELDQCLLVRRCEGAEPADYLTRLGTVALG